MSASILVSGVHTSLVALSGHPVAAVSASFINRIAPNCRNNLLALTINGGPLGPFTTVLACSVQQNLAFDITLGLEWTVSVREWLISLNVPCNSETVLGLIYALRPSDCITLAIISSSHWKTVHNFPAYTYLLP
ncbi:hypothetical protein B0H10DRAFT_2222159 [Mycena sp. CBHHK59/15]|nr:hypothetical protein B0H10DRAFT_2222159 [Mycena sp. CBHHK59/15]